MQRIMLGKSVSVAVLAVVLFYLKVRRSPIPIQEQLDEYYDFIIVGAGSSGAIVASRLSEDPDVKVLLLEAGEAEFPGTEIPLFASSLPIQGMNWNYTSEPEMQCCTDRKEQKLGCSRGKILGGTSRMNWMVYVRASKHDYDRWEQEEGCEGWGYDDVLPYFIKAERNQDPEKVQSGYHGGQGPIGITTNLDEIGAKFIEAGKEIGYKEVDLNGPENIGFGEQEHNIYNGVRQDTAEVYIRPVMHRKNLHILTEAHVTKVLLEGKRAVGVEFFRHDQRKSVKTRKEIILSAGAFNSPQILLLSGIGPKEQLERHDIPVIKDLPVGQNLQNHYINWASIFSIDKPLSVTDKKVSSFWTSLQYKLFGTGYYAANHLTAGAHLRTTVQLPGSKEGQIQLLTGSLLIGAGSSAVPQKFLWNWDEESFESLQGVELDQEGFTTFVALNRPYSKGIKVATQLENTNAYKSIGARLLKKIHLKCLDHTWRSDEYWRCYVKHEATVGFHESGTCKMGAPEDPTVVLDTQLKVRGIEGLRVADTSIMPSIVSGNTNAAAFMIGEKAAQLIKDFYKT